jgi:hypothetical protein
MLRARANSVTSVELSVLAAKAELPTNWQPDEARASIDDARTNAWLAICRLASETANNEAAVYSDGGTGLVTTNGGTFGAHKGPVIVAGGDPAVFYCSFSDNLTLTNNDTGNPTPLASGNISVTIGYETWLPWWVVKRSIVPVDFTLRKTSQGWRWTKGTEIK